MPITTIAYYEVMAEWAKRYSYGKWRVWRESPGKWHAERSMPVGIRETTVCPTWEYAMESTRGRIG